MTKNVTEHDHWTQYKLDLVIGARVGYGREVYALDEKTHLCSSRIRSISISTSIGVVATTAVSFCGA